MAPDEKKLILQSKLLDAVDDIALLGDDEKVLLLDIVEILSKEPRAYDELSEVVQRYR